MWFRRYKVLWISILLIVIAMAVFSAHRRGFLSPTPLDEILFTLVRPLQWSITRGMRTVRSVWDGYINLVHVQRENRYLQQRLRELEQKLADYEELRAANVRLRRLLVFRSNLGVPSMAAQIIGDDSTGWFRTILIDKGRRHGVASRMPVVAPEGVVGQTIDCALGVSKVLLITDRNSAIDVMIQRSRTRGILEGKGQEDLCTMKFVARTADVKEGDRVITSGLGGIYPKGLLVGKVVAVQRRPYGLFQTVEVAPSVNFGRLEEVLVLLGGLEAGEGLSATGGSWRH